MEATTPGTARAWSPRRYEASPSITCAQLAQKIQQLGGASLVPDNFAGLRAELILRAQQLEALKDTDPSLLLILNTLRHRVQQPAVVMREEEPLSYLNMPSSSWHGFPIYKTNSLTSFVQELKAFTDAIPSDSLLADMRQALERTIRQYEAFLQAYQTGSDEMKAEMSAPAPELTGDSIGFFLIDYSSSLAMVCRDKYGFLSRENEFGNHAVRAMGGIHFKPNPKGLDFLGVAEEFMVHSLGEILSGSRTITAPTSLLKVSHISMLKVSKHPKKNREAYKTLMDAMVKGMSAGQIFEENPALFASVEKKAKDFSTVIQAGLSIEGVLLMQLLEALQNLEFLNARLTPQKVLEVLPRLMSDCYQSDLFDDYSHFRGSFNPSLLYESYLGFSATLSPDERFVEFQQLDAADSRREHVFMKLCKRNRSGMLAAFALVKKFPSLMKGAYLADVQRLPSSLALLQTLLPNSTPAQVMQSAPKLLERLDMYSYSAIYVLSLLTSPSDGKADNYMVQLEREPDTGAVRLMRVVGIDNDKAFEPPVRTNKLGQIYPGLKSIILCLPNSAMPVDPKFRSAFVALNPEMIVLQWLAELHEQNQRYARMESVGIIADSDKMEKKTGTRTLDIPITMPAALLQSIYEKLVLIHRMLSNDAACSHRKLLEAVEPLLARYYQNVLQTAKSPLEAQRSVYHGDYMTVGATGASLSEEAFGLAVRSPTLVNEKLPRNVPSLESVIRDFVTKLDLGGIDPVSPAFRAMLTIFSTKLPFVKRLPFNTLQLNSFLLHVAQHSDDTDLALMDSVLSAGASATATDEVGRTPLHHLLSRVSPQLPIALIKRILAESDVRLEEKDAAGQRPLHCLLRHLNTEGNTPASQALQMMLQAGVDVDGEDSGGGDSIIRQALRRDMPSAFARLALLGAGRQLFVNEVKPYLEKYAAIEEWKKEIRTVIKALVKVNHAIAVEYGMRSLLLPISVVPELQNVVIGLESGKGALRADIADRLFDAVDANKTDSTSFVYLTPYDQTVLCNTTPRSPFSELLCQQLATRLFGFSSPQCELFRTERTGLPALLYQHVDGFNYSAVLADAEKKDAMVKNIDMACFSEIVLLHFVTMQEVQRDDMYLVPHFSGRLRLFSLRNRGVCPEVAVRRERADKQGHEWVVLHRNYAFCMDQFTCPLDSVVRHRFLALDVPKALSACFTDMVSLQKKAEEIFGVEKTAAMGQPYRLGILSQSLHRRMQLLQTVLTETPASTSMLDLLGKVSHMLGAYYRSAFKARKTPDARYEYLADRSLAAAVEESFILPTEVYFNQPLFDLPLAAPDDWAGRVDFKQEVIYLSRVLNAYRTVRQLGGQLSNGTLDLSLVAALDEEAKARLLHRLTWSRLSEDKQRALFDGLFPRTGSWSLKCLYLDNCTSLDTETLVQALRQDRGNQLIEISINSAPLLDVHKLLNEISRRAPNIEKLRLVRVGTRTSASAKDRGTETAAAEPGKLLRFSVAKQLRLEDCHRLEFLRVTAPELRILELIDCEKLQGVELVSRDAKDNTAPHTNLVSLSVNSCPNVPAMYIDSVVVNCPNLRAVRYTNQCNAALLAYYFSLYNTWSPMNVSLLSVEGTLNLSGSLVTDPMFDRIIPYMGTVRLLDISGCTHVTMQAIAAVVASCPSVEVIRLASPTPPEERATRTNATTATQLLPNGRLMTGHADGQLRVFEVGWDLVERKESALSKLHSDGITLIEVGACGQVACGSVDRAITVVQFNTLMDKVESSVKLKGHDAAIRAARFLNESTLVTVSTDRAVKFWEISSGRCVRSWPGDSTKNSFLVVEFISNTRFVGGGEGALLSFFSVDTGKEYKQVISDNGSVHAVRALTADSFASAGANGRVKVWSSVSGECLFTMTGHTGTVRGLEKLPLTRMASYTDNTVRVWDFSTGVCLSTVPFNTISLTGLRCMPDGRLLLTTAQSLIMCSPTHPLYGRGSLNLTELDFLRGIRFTVEQEGTDALVLSFAEARGNELVTMANGLGSFLRPLVIGDSVKLTPSEDKIVISPIGPQIRRQDLQVLLEGIALRQKDKVAGRKLRVSAWNVTRLQITGAKADSPGAAMLASGASSGSSDTTASGTSPPLSPATSPKGRSRNDGGRLSIMAAPSKSPSPPSLDTSTTRKPGLRGLAASVFFNSPPTEAPPPVPGAVRAVSPLKMQSSAPVPIPSPPNSPPREPPNKEQSEVHAVSRSQSRGELYSRPSDRTSVFPAPSSSPSPSPSPNPSHAPPQGMTKASPSPARSPFDTPPSTASALEQTSDAQPLTGSGWVIKKTPTQTFLRGVKGIRSSSDPVLGVPATPAAASSAGSPSSSSPLASASGGSDRQPEPSPREERPSDAKAEQPKLGAIRMAAARRPGSERVEK